MISIMALIDQHDFEMLLKAANYTARFGQSYSREARLAIDEIARRVRSATLFSETLDKAMFAAADVEAIGKAQYEKDYKPNQPLG